MTALTAVYETNGCERQQPSHRTGPVARPYRLKVLPRHCGFLLIVSDPCSHHPKRTRLWDLSGLTTERNDPIIAKSPWTADPLKRLRTEPPGNRPTPCGPGYYCDVP